MRNWRTQADLALDGLDAGFEPTGSPVNGVQPRVVPIESLLDGIETA